MATTQTILWGNVSSDGSLAQGSPGVKTCIGNVGVYLIDFGLTFTVTPAIVGSQTQYGSATEGNTDGVVFPIVSTSSATAVTGDGSGNHQNRSFSFVVVGTVSSSG